MLDSSGRGDSPATKQSEAWGGEFGSQYSERNLFDAPELDKIYQAKYGVTRSVLNEDFLKDIPRSASILEVGCNHGNQLILLHQMGFENLNGVEIHKEVVKSAQSRVPWAKLTEGSVLNIPFREASFDLVFTSGLLIHIAPQDISVAMDEIFRCAKDWIWGLEYYAPEMMEVQYRGQSGLLWKADYARIYAERFADLELIKEKRLAYPDNGNIDSMFLLRRKTGKH
jgi:pseudaminic acid biosynthesis-associated methylase